MTPIQTDPDRQVSKTDWEVFSSSVFPDLLMSLFLGEYFNCYRWGFTQVHIFCQESHPIMATEFEVRQYLAYWFQLGKGVVFHNGEETILPKPVIVGDHYSQAFEDCWIKLNSPQAGDCYLEGTEITITELLTDEWDLDPCVRCTMPIPLHKYGLPPPHCPCFDLKNWPDNEIPLPRDPISSHDHLRGICQRLMNKCKVEQNHD